MSLWKSKIDETSALGSKCQWWTHEADPDRLSCTYRRYSRPTSTVVLLVCWRQSGTAKLGTCAGADPSRRGQLASYQIADATNTELFGVRLSATRSHVEESSISPSKHGLEQNTGHTVDSCLRVFHSECERLAKTCCRCLPWRSPGCAATFLTFLVICLGPSAWAGSS